MRRDEWDEVDRSDHTDVRLDWRECCLDRCEHVSRASCDVDRCFLVAATFGNTGLT